MLLRGIQGSLANSIAHLKNTVSRSLQQPKRTSSVSSFSDALQKAQPSAQPVVASASPSVSVSGPSLKDLFSTGVKPASAASPKLGPAVDPTSVPTPQSVFGPNVWLENPQGRDPNGNPF